MSTRLDAEMDMMVRANKAEERIAELEAENARLREALSGLECETRGVAFDCPDENPRKPLTWCQVCRAKAALAERE